MDLQKHVCLWFCDSKCTPSEHREVILVVVAPMLPPGGRDKLAAARREDRKEVNPRRSGSGFGFVALFRVELPEGQDNRDQNGRECADRGRRAKLK